MNFSRRRHSFLISIFHDENISWCRERKADIEEIHRCGKLIRRKINDNKIKWMNEPKKNIPIKSEWHYVRAFFSINYLTFRKCWMSNQFVYKFHTNWTGWLKSAIKENYIFYEIHRDRETETETETKREKTRTEIFCEELKENERCSEAQQHLIDFPFYLLWPLVFDLCVFLSILLAVELPHITVVIAMA